jgi:phosphomannomutase
LPCSAVKNTLIQSGCAVIDLGVATTPTVEIAVLEEQADGGIIITASHNPIEWNALKLLNNQGEFLTAEQGNEMIDIAESGKLNSAAWNNFGIAVTSDAYDRIHINKVLELPFINPGQIEAQNYRVLVDAVEGAGSTIVPQLCHALGMNDIIELACAASGIFPRNPEPIEKNLTQTLARMKEEQCDFGIIVDPDVDRLVMICEDGTLFGEEYTLVACADYYLSHNKGHIANNLSSSRALRDIALKHGVECFSSKVGEANVIEEMKRQNATIGGEGNGGVILPEIHYGRDALVGIALFVQAFCQWQLQHNNQPLSAFKKTFPEYHMAKQKLNLADTKGSVDSAFEILAKTYASEKVTTIDGLKIDFEASWIHMRKSNTEPIVRIYTEAKTAEDAHKLASKFETELLEALK